MSNRYLVIVQAPDCFQHSASTFVINEFLLAGWLRGVSEVGPRITMTGEVTADVAVQLADALERMRTMPKDKVHDALCGDSGGGKDSFCVFLRGGEFQLVDGAVTKPNELQ